MPILKEVSVSLQEIDFRIEVESSNLENNDDREKEKTLIIPKNDFQNEEKMDANPPDRATLPIDEYQLTKKADEHDDNFVPFLTYQEVIQNEPIAYEEAIKCKDFLKWKNAMEEEMSSLLKYNTLVLVEKP
ncbi:hypothetical protein Adt_27776 [Abeliophyllum distichum]|uniref:Uncharacterized protein n=1 Tax=Abeliophyllum distichum TaxID=126358 RepID=A0ABD1RV18_9LAMI